MPAATIDSLESRAKETLRPAIEGQLSPAERIKLFVGFLKSEENRILQRHREGEGGLVIAAARSELIDTVLRAILKVTGKSRDASAMASFALVATGGYGRSLLNPGSDIDILFLMPRSSNKLPPALRETVQDVLYLLWDMGFKVGHACRSIGECLEQAKLNHENRTALMDARLIAGDAELFSKLEARFAQDFILRGQREFFQTRIDDITTRHGKYSNTVYLQEPSVKESPGGLRDYQAAQWVSRVKHGTADLQKLVAMKVLTQNAYKEMHEAFDFIHRVRNELHFHTGKATDQLTLQLQGVVATAFKYPQRDILRSTEAFMRDYYRHSRHVFQHTTSLLEALEIEEAQKADNGIRSYLTFRKKSREEFDGFVARDGRLFPVSPDLFEEDPQRLMRLFQHCQLRNLRLSPQLRRLIAQHWDDIDRNFRVSKPNREVFQAILERKGEVARTLRLMHRIGFLGRYLPEFGALDCLVQHEFYHRYTADEHTLRCADQLDALVHDESRSHSIYRKLFHEIQDPFAFYLAIILHDTGRAENVREHIDGSAMLAARLCNRLQIRGARRSLIMFLVDNHLTFWRTATTRNLDDPAVIEEFANIMKTPANLDALFLFTYCDSNGTSPDAWSGWKESLMIQLHTATRKFLKSGLKEYTKMLDDDRKALRDEVCGMMREDYQSYVKEHFERMPAPAFHFRQAAHIVTQVRTVRHFLQAEETSGDPMSFCVKWIDHTEKGYSELVIATRDKPLLLEKLCCALASQQINILSADLFSREDGIVVNIFRVCTTNFEPVSQSGTRKRFLETFEEILRSEDHQPEKYLKRRTNFLKAREDRGIPVPVRAYVSNNEHPAYTVVELQALDRIGLLHDVFHVINSHDLNTAHARICTEKGVAMDTLYLTMPDGGQISNPTVLAKLEAAFNEVIDLPETPA